MRVTHIGYSHCGTLYCDGKNYYDIDGVVWTSKQLNAGCGETMTDPLVNEGLIYCMYCDEMCDIEEFLIEGDEDVFN